MNKDRGLIMDKGKQAQLAPLDIRLMAVLAGAKLLIRIIRTGDSRLWIWFGIVAGLGIENKHSTLLFIRIRGKGGRPLSPMGYRRGKPVYLPLPGSEGAAKAIVAGAQKLELGR